MTEPNPRAGRRVLLAITGLFFLPVVAALVWYIWAPSLAPPPSTHGTLVDPARALQPFRIERSGQAPYTLDDLRGRWVLLNVIGEDCGESCIKRVHDTRQIRLALDKDTNRVRRVALAPQGRATPGLASILDRHPELTVLASGPDGPLAGQLPGGSPVGAVFIIDPHGNVVLRYAPDMAADGILDDLQKLLKLSRIG